MFHQAVTPTRAGDIRAFGYTYPVTDPQHTSLVRESISEAM
jgi:hypothetical protein